MKYYIISEDMLTHYVKGEQELLALIEAGATVKYATHYAKYLKEATKALEPTSAHIYDFEEVANKIIENFVSTGEFQVFGESSLDD